MWAVHYSPPISPAFPYTLLLSSSSHLLLWPPSSSLKVFPWDFLRAFPSCCSTLAKYRMNSKRSSRSVRGELQFFFLPSLSPAPPRHGRCCIAARWRTACNSSRKLRGTNTAKSTQSTLLASSREVCGVAQRTFVVVLTQALSILTSTDCAAVNTRCVQPTDQAILH